MKKQTMALSRLNPVKLGLAAIFLSGLVGVFPYIGHTQDQIHVATLPALALQRMTLAGAVNSTKNPLQIASLHWYDANLTRAFAAGSGPYGLAIDGANIWVTNATSNK